MSLSCHKQVSLLSTCSCHDKSLYCEHWTDKRKYFYVYENQSWAIFDAFIKINCKLSYLKVLLTGLGMTRGRWKARPKVKLCGLISPAPNSK